MRKVLLTALVLLLAGCASGGLQLAALGPDELSRFPIGSAEKADVVRVNGHPSQVLTLPNNREGWVYVVCPEGRSEEERRYTVEFGADGRVMDVHCVASEGGLLSARSQRAAN